MSSPTCGFDFDIMETARLLESQLRQLEEAARRAKTERSANLLLERKLEKDLEALQLIYKREVVTTKKLSKRCSRINVVDTWKPPTVFANASNVMYDHTNVTLAGLATSGSGVTSFVDPTTRAASAFVYHPEPCNDNLAFSGEVWRDPHGGQHSITASTTLAITTTIPFYQDSAANPLIPRYVDYPVTIPSIAVTYDEAGDVDMGLASLLASSSLVSSSDLADAVLKVMDRKEEDVAVVHGVLSTSEVDNGAAGRKRGGEMDDGQIQRKRVRFAANEEDAENDAGAVWRNATVKRPARRGVFGGRVDRTRSYKYTSK